MKRLVLTIAMSLMATCSLAAGKFSTIGMSFNGSAQFPASYNSVYGWRFAVFSGGHQDMYGLATALFANNDAAVGGHVGGLQTAILFNTANDCEFGIWQIAGMFNTVSRGCNGLQLSLLYNKSGEYFNGVNLALCNYVSGDAMGMQLGLVNIATSIYGMQIGLVNVADALGGVQVGLVNVVHQSDMFVFPVVRLGW